ncbi:MAG: hypothetical protein UY03_C0040G0003 [Parcubacteria group bacterium GW2011_GWA2_47_64]|nr:MAG: hypothetical protein UY03_C0040G0003 [Parcubacteria group bacterium GW2011_GWA2_47_64]
MDQTAPRNSQKTSSAIDRAVEETGGKVGGKIIYAREGQRICHLEIRDYNYRQLLNGKRNGNKNKDNQRRHRHC